MTVRIIQGDCIEVMRTLPPGSVNCCVTSPPYWGLRDYGVAGQIGLENTHEEYVEKMADVFKEVKRLLREDGTLWLNIGDSYASSGGACPRGAHCGKNTALAVTRQPNRVLKPGSVFKNKDLMGIPWRVAFRLQEDGWYLRQCIIWHKPNVMPESVTDRCTNAHEYVFLLAKSEHYYFNAEAIVELQSEHERTRRIREQQKGLSTTYTLKRDKEHGQQPPGANGCARSVLARHKLAVKGTRNRRSVWIVPNVAGGDEHLARFPADLISPMIFAGCPEGGTVLDPFAESGTTGKVSEISGRNSILIELNPVYIKISKRQTEQQGLGI